MNVETKEVRNYKEYLKFGWEKAAENKRHVGRSCRTTYTLIRDRDMKNYRLILPLEAQYFNLKDQIQTYNPVDGWIAFILFLILIIPGVIYLLIKNAEKNKVETINKAIFEEQGKILKALEQLK